MHGITRPSDHSLPPLMQLSDMTSDGLLSSDFVDTLWGNIGPCTTCPSVAWSRTLVTGVVPQGSDVYALVLDFMSFSLGFCSSRGSFAHFDAVRSPSLKTTWLTRLQNRNHFLAHNGSFAKCRTSSPARASQGSASTYSSIIKIRPMYSVSSRIRFLSQPRGLRPCLS